VVVKVGRKATLKAPSANSDRKWFGSRLARKKASAIGHGRVVERLKI
jgi:hypothetical protein